MLGKYIITPLVFGLVVVFALAVLTQISLAETFNLQVLMQAVESTFAEPGSLIMVGVLFLLFNFCTFVVSFMKTGRRPN